MEGLGYRNIDNLIADSTPQELRERGARTRKDAITGRRFNTCNRPKYGEPIEC